MSSSIAPEIRRRAGVLHRSRMLYVAVLLFSFHWSLVAYVNSTYLHQFVSESTLGLLYIIGSVLTIIALLYMSRVLRHYGSYRLTIALAVAETLILIGLAFHILPSLTIGLFVLHLALVPLLLFTIDIFTEQLIGKKERVTGGKRGLVLAILSLGTALATLLAGLILGRGAPRFMLLYIVSATCMLIFCRYLATAFKTFRDPLYGDINVFRTLRYFWITHDFRFVFLAHFLLQLFFAWMVIYVPLYLATVIGFTWDQIGLVFFVGLLAYVFCEYPIGEIADRYIGEKEMMAVGFLILTMTTLYLGFLHTPLLIPWMVAMFMTRVGASLVEVTTESYFFKHTTDADADIISFFRTTRPLSYILAALLGSLALFSLPPNYTFILFGLLMLPGIICALLLKDTR